ncbi:lamin tail domain-containing protein [Gammaproteobacteria bacterium]|nr:lamin tail domain-containing protein [Gammaproteobacteria bacterium]
MSKNYLLGFTILFLTACGGSSSGSSGSSSTGPINAAPVISSGNTYSVAENTTAIGSVAASDADGDALNYVLTGDDSSLVTLTGTTLSFNAAPDFEAPSDANTDNVYKVTLVVSDGLAKDAKDLEISVTNVNEGPQLIVGSSYTVSENTTTVTTATVSDSSSAVAFSLSGTDSAAMTIGESSGVLAFAANPDFEAPADADGDNVYNVTITATDDAGSNSADVTVTVTDVVECTGACDLFISEYAEGSSNNKYLEIANFTGAEVALSGYALPSVGNAPDTVGEYEFWNADIFGANDTIADGDVYVVCHGSSEQAILDRCDSEHNFLSNGDDGRKLVKGTEDSYTVVDVFGDFQGDPGSGWDICGVEAGTKDHTIVKKEGKEGNADWTSSRGTTADDCDWIVADNDAFLDTAWDGLGSHCYNSANDAVSFTSSATFSVAENSTAVGTVAAGVVGCNTGDTVTMALSGADAALFTIDAAGALAFAAAPDFEVTGSASGTNDYTVVVTATAGSKTAEQTITVTVTDVEEADPTQVQFTGTFGGAVIDGTTYTHPAGAEAWAGFANENADLYPFSFPNGGTVTFTASAAVDTNINFKFERLPFPDVDPSFSTANVTISGAEEKTYTVEFDTQGENTFASLLMYIVERDQAVTVKNVVVAQKAATPAGDLMDMSGTFGDVGYSAETNGFSFPATAQVWGGWAHNADGDAGTGMYPFTFTEAGKVTFKATAPNGDVRVRFKFERLPYPDTTPEFYTEYVTVTGAEESSYEVAVPAQGSNTFSSFLMYFETADGTEIYMTDFYVTADAKDDTGGGDGDTSNGGGTMVMTEAFGGATIDGTTYNVPAGSESWAGFAHDPAQTEGFYPIKFPNGGKIIASFYAVDTSTRVYFKFEKDAYPNTTPDWQSDNLVVTSSPNTMVVNIPATTNTYKNFLMYIVDQDRPIVLESVVVTPND